MKHSFTWTVDEKYADIWVVVKSALWSLSNCQWGTDGNFLTRCVLCRGHIYCLKARANHTVSLHSRYGNIEYPEAHKDPRRHCFESLGTTELAASCGPPGQQNEDGDKSLSNKECDWETETVGGRKQTFSLAQDYQWSNYLLECPNWLLVQDKEEEKSSVYWHHTPLTEGRICFFFFVSW